MRDHWKKHSLCEQIEKLGEVRPDKEITTNCFIPLSTESTWLVYFCGYTANLLLVTLGALMVWPSSVISKLTSNDPDMNPFEEPITTLQISIIVSAPAVSSTFGLMIMAKVADTIGRKKTMIYLGVSIVCSICCIAFGTHVYVYYIFFFINGFCSAGIYVNVPVYNSEIADDNNRAWLGCFVGLGIPTGFLIGYISGTLTTSVTFITLTCAAPALLHVLLCFFVIESPMYLAGKGMKAESLCALEKLRIYKNFSDLEIEYNCMEQLTVGKHAKREGFLNLFKTRGARKALYICFTLCITQQVSGISIILAYLAPLFNETGSTVSGNTIGILIGVLKVTVFIIAAFVVNKFGRRPLLLLSSLGCAISMFFIALYFYLKQINSPVIDHIRWLPVMFLIIFIVTYGLGLGPIPIAFTGEMFRNEIRTTGVATVSMSDSFVVFAVSFGFPLLAEAYGVYFCMFIYAFGSFVGFIVIYLSLPETRGKSLMEIQDILNR